MDHVRLNTSNRTATVLCDKCGRDVPWGEEILIRLPNPAQEIPGAPKSLKRRVCSIECLRRLRVC